MSLVVERSAMAAALERLYERYNRREYVHPDPLEFLYRYEDLRDREIVGLVASSLAYGRVAQILRSVAHALERMPRPYKFVVQSSERQMAKAFEGFKHRFTTGDDLSHMLSGAKRLLEERGSLQEAFLRGMKNSDETVLPALDSFSRSLSLPSGCRAGLIPSPEAGSACKRLNLYLRWMVRRDAVDPGGWENIRPAQLVIPLDTHMHRICSALGMTRRRQADLRAALEITKAFREIEPQDPVKYDFALTRLGIRGGGQLAPFLAQFGAREVI